MTGNWSRAAPKKFTAVSALVLAAAHKAGGGVLRADNNIFFLHHDFAALPYPKQRLHSLLRLSCFLRRTTFRNCLGNLINHQVVRVTHLRIKISTLLLSILAHTNIPRCIVKVKFIYWKCYKMSVNQSR